MPVSLIARIQLSVAASDLQMGVLDRHLVNVLVVKLEQPAFVGAQKIQSFAHTH